MPEHYWNKDYVAEKDTHSNVHQLLVLSKSPETKFKGEGKILYIDYVSTKDHPCPTPLAMSDFIFKSYFKPGMVVAGPFMGTATFGKKVLQNGGEFIDYEQNKAVFDLTEATIIDLA